MELLAWSIILVLCRHAHLECLWRIVHARWFHLAIVSCLWLMASVIELLDWSTILILYSFSLMELLGWSIIHVLCRQHILNACEIVHARWFYPVTIYCVRLLASVIGLLDIPAILILWSSVFQIGSSSDIFICPIAMKLGWFSNCCDCSLWVPAVFLPDFGIHTTNSFLILYVQLIRMFSGTSEI